ncbi:hypothetical protein V8F06_009143 [Rhypophila decipiens]
MASSTINKTYPGFLPPPPGFPADIAHPSESLFAQIVPKVIGKVFTDDCKSWTLGCEVEYRDRNPARYGLPHLGRNRRAGGQFQHIRDPRWRIVQLNLDTIFIKTSILLSFYIRFAVPNRPFQIASYVMFFVVVAYCIPMAFVSAWLCRPVESRRSTVPLMLLSCFLIPIWLLWPRALVAPKAKKIASSLVRAAEGFISPDMPAQGHEFSVFGAISLQVRRWSRRLGRGPKTDPHGDGRISMDDFQAPQSEITDERLAAEEMARWWC